MKKYLIFALCLLVTPAVADWWKMPTICKPSANRCWPSMGVGFDGGLWDAESACWGMKLICPGALTANAHEPEPISKVALGKNTGINTDFDTNALNSRERCFGLRKTTANGAMATVNGQSVRVWCRGVLDNPDEELANGEITYGTQPTCAQLAANGFVATLNGNCYGTKYATNDYFIECGTALLPTRIVQLRGATGWTSGAAAGGTGLANTNSIFDAMQQTSTTQRNEHFNR
ncbi:MAG: hypothetical protein FWF34_02840 [Alphaproteobacteria bacterium]|nr:hypothetical protein [Alphaproteobacteria bacterium]MCL2890167.1 hypothetical protein [Alphaproteobacteria bacterium]